MPRTSHLHVGAVHITHVYQGEAGRALAKALVRIELVVRSTNGRTYCHKRVELLRRTNIVTNKPIKEFSSVKINSNPERDPSKSLEVLGGEKCGDFLG